MFKKMLFRYRFNRFARSLEQFSRKRSFVSPEKASSCLLFRTYSSPAEHLVSRLKQIYPTVKFEQLWFVSSGEDFNTGAFDFVFSKSDLGGKSGFRKSDINKCLDKDYDWLLDLSEDDSPFAPAVLERSSAKCKIAWRERAGYSPDIIMGGIESREEYVEKLHSFLKMLDK